MCPQLVIHHRRPLCSARVTGPHRSYWAAPTSQPSPPSPRFLHLASAATLPHRSRWDLHGYRTLACEHTNTLGPFQSTFSRLVNLHGSICRHSTSRLLSCLRIKRNVTIAPARLNTGPVVSSYPGRLPTCLNVRHSHVASSVP